METYRYSNPKPLAWAVCTLAVVYALLLLVQFGDDLYLARLLSRIVDGDSSAGLTLYHHAHLVATLEHVVMRAMQVVFLVNAPVFLVWAYRAAANNRALGARALEYTPGWTVGWFFVPFANLIMPCLAIQEIWTTSHDPSERTASASHVPVIAWWLLRILSTLALLVAIAMRPGHLPRLEMARALLHHAFPVLVHIGLEMVAVGLFVHIVWRVSALQVAHARPAPPLELDDAPEPTMQPA